MILVWSSDGGLFLYTCCPFYIRFAVGVSRSPRRTVHISKYMPHPPAVPSHLYLPPNQPSPPNPFILPYLEPFLSSSVFCKLSCTVCNVSRSARFLRISSWITRSSTSMREIVWRRDCFRPSLGCGGGGGDGISFVVLDFQKSQQRKRNN